jgi:hypothetical protein
MDNQKNCHDTSMRLRGDVNSHAYHEILYEAVTDLT